MDFFNIPRIQRKNRGRLHGLAGGIGKPPENDLSRLRGRVNVINGNHFGIQKQDQHSIRFPGRRRIEFFIVFL
jgi:hypothetical protein